MTAMIHKQATNTLKREIREIWRQKNKPFRFRHFNGAKIRKSQNKFVKSIFWNRIPQQKVTISFENLFFTKFIFILKSFFSTSPVKLENMKNLYIWNKTRKKFFLLFCIGWDRMNRKILFSLHQKTFYGVIYYNIHRKWHEKGVYVMTRKLRRG